MILHELVGGNEAHPVYQELEISNGDRQYGFLQSAVEASIKIGRPFLSTSIIKALNYHAIACLHSYAGEFRPCEVTVGAYHPPAHHRVQALMDDLVNDVNRQWETADELYLCSYVLWRINHIHPFINGNGRTARAASYFVLCVKAGGLLSGTTILPQLLKQNRPAYVAALQAVDQNLNANNALDLDPVVNLVAQLVQVQIASATPAAPTPNTP